MEAIEAIEQAMRKNKQTIGFYFFNLTTERSQLGKKIKCRQGKSEISMAVQQSLQNNYHQMNHIRSHISLLKGHTKEFLFFWLNIWILHE